MKESKNLKLIEQERRMIEIGLQQIEEGKIISNEEARKRIKDMLLNNMQ